jgi:thiamine pyrophosphate-dependent acetolactate synthase large subunit-like protein
MKVVDAIARAVAAEDVKVAFAVPDEVTVFAAHALREHGLRVVRPRHEQGAIAMADGYSRVMDGPAVCTVGAGPAIAQSGTGLVTAARRGSPVLILLGRLDDPGNAKEFDVRRFIESTGARYLEVRSAASVAEDMHEAFRLVRLREGPVVLAIPNGEDLHRECPGGASYAATRDVLRDPAGIDPGSETIEEAAGMLAGARRPVIVAGRGAVAAEAGEALWALADRVGALLATSIQARELFRGHPRNVGVIGSFATEGTTELVVQADCVLAVGIALNRYQTGGGPLAPGARVIQIDCRPGPIGRFAEVDLAIVADARSAVGAIDRCLELAEISHSSFWTSEQARPAIEAARVMPAAAKAPPTGPLPLTAALALLEDALPRDRVVVVDGGKFTGFAIDAVSVPDPGSWIWTLDFGSIGLGLSMGIGAALGKPGRHCVLVAGDGGFLMSIQELETAVRELIPLTIVVLNDGAYAAEVHFLERRNLPSDLAVFHDVDLAAVALALGAQAATIRTVEDFAHVPALLAARNGPLVLDVKVTEAESHRAFSY